MATTKKKSTTKKKPSSKKLTSKKSNKAVGARSTTKKTTAKKKSTTKAKTTIKKTSISASDKGLNTWNWFAAMAHAASGAVILILSNVVHRGITTNYLTQDTIASTDSNTVMSQATRNLFDINVAYLLAAMFFVAAIIHILAATIWRVKYEADIKSGVSRARWIEYGIGGGIMMATVALLSGVSDISALVVTFGTMSVAGLLGLVMELYKKANKSVNWFVFATSALSVIVSVAVIVLGFLGAYKYGEGSLPTYNYWITATVFVYLIILAGIVVSHYKGKGRFTDYISTEKAYIFLSFAAKSALAWQVYVAILS